MPKTLRLVLPHGLMLLAAIVLYVLATRIQSNASAGRIGPDVWPRAILVIMGLLCVWEIGKRLALRSRTLPAESQAAGTAPGENDGTAAFHAGKLSAGIALVFGYVFVVPWIGFFVATALFLAAFPWFGGLRRPVLAASLGLAGSFALVVVFMRIAYISLPLGEGPFKAFSIALLAAIGVS